MATSFLNRWFHGGKALQDSDQLNKAIGANVLSLTNGIQATGTTLATATPLGSVINGVETTTGVDAGVVLPTNGPVGLKVQIINSTGGEITVYAPAGTTVNGAASIAQPSASLSVWYTKYGPTSWIAV